MQSFQPLPGTLCWHLRRTVLAIVIELGGGTPNDDAEKVEAALRMEVAEFSWLVFGLLEAMPET